MADGVSTVRLAEMLGVTRGRISQLVGEGKLDGCYQGLGRARRFDPIASARALGHRIDPGQRLGNGAPTQAAAGRILQMVPAESPSPPPEPAGAGPGGGPSPPSGPPGPPAAEPSGYELARAVKAQEEARRLRRLNAEAEGQYVLADEVARQVQRQIGREIAEVESFLRDAARRIADRHGLDFRTVRAELRDQWRSHRGARADAATTLADTAVASDVEEAEDI